MLMIAHHAEHGNKHSPSRMVNEFDDFLRGSGREAVRKGVRIWRGDDTSLNECGVMTLCGIGSSFTRSAHTGLKRADLQALL